MVDVSAGDWAAPPLTSGCPGSRLRLDHRGGARRLRRPGPAGGRPHGYSARLGHAQPVSYPYRLRYSRTTSSGCPNRRRSPAPSRRPGAWSWSARPEHAGELRHRAQPRPPPTRAVPAGHQPTGSSRAGPSGVTSTAARTRGRASRSSPGWRASWVSSTRSSRALAAMERRGVEGGRRRCGTSASVSGCGSTAGSATRQDQQAFFHKCRDVGVVGAKIDFFDHEAKEVVDLYRPSSAIGGVPHHGQLPRRQQAVRRGAHLAATR